LSCGLVSAQSHRLAKTYIDYEYYGSGQAIPGGSVRTALGPVADIVCPGSGTCTIQANQFVQVGRGTASGNEYTVGYYLDGVANCDEQILASTPQDGTYAIGATSEFQANVSAGKHTVQTYIYSLDPTYVTTKRSWGPTTWAASRMAWRSTAPTSGSRTAAATLSPSCNGARPRRRVSGPLCRQALADPYWN
jgi:hypothetical protein